MNEYGPLQLMMLAYCRAEPNSPEQKVIEKAVEDMLYMPILQRKIHETYLSDQALKESEDG